MSHRNESLKIMITHLSNIENNQDNTSVEHSRNQNYEIYFSRSPDQSTPREGKISKSLQAVLVTVRLFQNFCRQYF